MDPQSVEQCLAQYRKYLFEEHIKVLESFLQKSKIHNSKKYNFHYTNCCWSDPTCTEGPDTCSCCYFDMLVEDVKKIMAKYEVLLHHSKTKTIKRSNHKSFFHSFRSSETDKTSKYES